MSSSIFPTFSCTDTISDPPVSKSEGQHCVHYVLSAAVYGFSRDVTTLPVLPGGHIKGTSNLFAVHAHCALLFLVASCTQLVFVQLFPEQVECGFLLNGT